MKPIRLSSTRNALLPPFTLPPYPSRAKLFTLIQEFGARLLTSTPDSPLA